MPRDANHGESNSNTLVFSLLSKTGGDKCQWTCKRITKWHTIVRVVSCMDFMLTQYFKCYQYDFFPLSISGSWSIPSSSGKTSGVSYCLEGKLPQPVLRGGMCLTRTYMQSGSLFLVQQLSFRTWPGSTSNSAGLRAPLLKIFLLLVTGSVTDLLPILNMWSGEDAVRRHKFKYMLHRVTKMVPCSSLLCWYVWQQWPKTKMSSNFN